MRERTSTGQSTGGAMPGRWKISRINIKRSIRAEAKVGSGVRSQEIRHNRMKFIGVS